MGQTEKVEYKIRPFILLCPLETLEQEYLFGHIFRVEEDDKLDK